MGLIFFIFVRAISPYFCKQPSECLLRQSIETEGMEDGRKLAYLLTGIQVLRLESHQAR